VPRIRAVPRPAPEPHPSPSVRTLLRGVIEFGDLRSQEHLRHNWSRLSLVWEKLSTVRPQRIIYDRVASHLAEHGEVPSMQGLVDYFAEQTDVGAIEAVQELGVIERCPAHIRTNYNEYAKQAVEFERRIAAQAIAKEFAARLNAGHPQEGVDHIAEAFARFAERARTLLATSTAAGTPTAESPLQGLPLLSKMALVGADKILAMSRQPIEYVWDGICDRGLKVLLAASPGGGKTTLLFWLMAARAHVGTTPIHVLGRKVVPAPAGSWIVVIEDEHSEESSARIIVKTCRLLGMSEQGVVGALARFVFVSRKGVKIGDGAWVEVEKMIEVGIVSDVFLDTLASVAPGDANSERDQVAIFDRLTSAIEKAPAPQRRPMVWAAAHVRKATDGMPTIEDISGSTQRAGQPDVLIAMKPTRLDGKVTSIKVNFPKVREQDADKWPEPVEYRLSKDGFTLLTPDSTPAEKPLKERIVDALTARGPMTASALSKDLGRDYKDIQEALTALFEEKRIVSKQIEIRGRSYKAFEIRPSSVSSDDEQDEPRWSGLDDV